MRTFLIENHIAIEIHKADIIQSFEHALLERDVMVSEVLHDSATFRTTRPAQKNALALPLERVVLRVLVVDLATTGHSVRRQ